MYFPILVSSVSSSLNPKASLRLHDHLGPLPSSHILPNTRRAPSHNQIMKISSSTSPESHSQNRARRPHQGTIAPDPPLRSGCSNAWGPAFWSSKKPSFSARSPDLFVFSIGRLFRDQRPRLPVLGVRSKRWVNTAAVRANERVRMWCGNTLYPCS